MADNPDEYLYSRKESVERILQKNYKAHQDSLYGVGYIPTPKGLIPLSRFHYNQGDNARGVRRVDEREIFDIDESSVEPILWQSDFYYSERECNNVYCEVSKRVFAFPSGAVILGPGSGRGDMLPCDVNECDSFRVVDPETERIFLIRDWKPRDMRIVKNDDDIRLLPGEEKVLIYSKEMVAGALESDDSLKRVQAEIPKDNSWNYMVNNNKEANEEYEEN